MGNGCGVNSRIFWAWNLLTLDVLTFLSTDHCDINPFIWENHFLQKLHNIDGYDLMKMFLVVRWNQYYSYPFIARNIAYSGTKIVQSFQYLPLVFFEVFILHFLLYMLDLKIVMLVSFDFKKSYLEWHSNNKIMPIFSVSILI